MQTWITQCQVLYWRIFIRKVKVCTNGTRVIVHESVYDEFVLRVTRRTELLVIGDSADMETQLGALISEKHMNKVLGYIDAAKTAGARLVCGGDRVVSDVLAKGFFVKPTVFADCTDDMLNVIDEIFGLVMSILSFSDEEEVVTRASSTKFVIASGIFTLTFPRAHRVIAKLQAGICWINTWGASPVEMPVGGFKQSGIGCENGIETLNYFTQVKSVYVELGDVGCLYE
jgi:betaine-aldehyde dehydrogenase